MEETVIKATRREVSQLVELQKGNMVNKGASRKYNSVSITEALKTAKQRLTALATRLKRYTKEGEARRTEPAKIHLCKTYSKQNCLMESCGYSNVFTFWPELGNLGVDRASNAGELGPWPPLKSCSNIWTKTNKKQECKTLVGWNQEIHKSRDYWGNTYWIWGICVCRYRLYN